MHECPVTVFPQQIRWETDGTSRIPFQAYTDEALYRKELDRLFYNAHWCYVGLEAEIPNAGDFKRTVIGERSVLLVRDKDASIHVVENVCAHRGMAFCRERHGNRESLTCPYHQWNYTLSGDLQGVPFRRGVKQDGKVNGGMPADFNPAEHGLTKLKVATRGGVVFASFDHSVEPLEEFLGPTILGYFDRLFNGRKLTILGYNRQRIPGNWKLMQENIKDPYHPGLLHTWFVTFGLWRADNKAALKMDAHHRHAADLAQFDVVRAYGQVGRQIAIGGAVIAAAAGLVEHQRRAVPALELIDQLQRRRGGDHAVDHRLVLDKKRGGRPPLKFLPASQRRRPEETAVIRRSRACSRCS